MKECSCHEDQRKRTGVKTYSSYKQENEWKTNFYITVWGNLNAFVTQRSRVDFWEKSVVWRRVISKYKSKYSFSFTFEVVYGRTCLSMSGRTVRDHDWCVWIYFGYMTYFQLLINCTSGRVHVHLCLDFSRAYPKRNWLVERRKNQVMTE